MARSIEQSEKNQATWQQPLYSHPEKGTLHEHPEEVPGALETASDAEVVAATERVITKLATEYKSGRKRSTWLIDQMGRIDKQTVEVTNSLGTKLLLMERGALFAEDAKALLSDLQRIQSKLPRQFAQARQLWQAQQDGQGKELKTALERAQKSEDGEVREKAQLAAATYDQIIDQLQTAFLEENEKRIMDKLGQVISQLQERIDTFQAKPELVATPDARWRQDRTPNVLKLRNLVAGILGAVVLLTAQDALAQERRGPVPDNGGDVAESDAASFDWVVEFYGSLETLVETFFDNTVANLDDSDAGKQTTTSEAIAAQEIQPPVPPITVETIGGWTRSAPLLINDTEVLSIRGGVELTAVTSVEDLAQLENYQEIDGVPHVVFETEAGVQSWRLEQQATGFWFLRDTQDSSQNTQPTHIWVVVISPDAEAPTLMRLDRLNINSFSGGLIDDATPTLTFAPTPETQTTRPADTAATIEPVGTLPPTGETPSPEPTQLPITPEAAPEPRATDSPATDAAPEDDAAVGGGQETQPAADPIATLTPEQQITPDGFLAGDETHFWYEGRLITVPEVLTNAGTMMRAESVFRNLFADMTTTNDGTGQRINYERGYISGIILGYDPDYLQPIVNGRTVNIPAVQVGYPILENGQVVAWGIVNAPYLEDSTVSVFNTGTNDLDNLNGGSNSRSLWTNLGNIRTPLSFSYHEGTKTLGELEPVVLAVVTNSEEVYPQLYLDAINDALESISPDGHPPTPEMVVTQGAPESVIPLQGILSFTS